MYLHNDAVIYMMVCVAMRQQRQLVMYMSALCQWSYCMKECVFCFVRVRTIAGQGDPSATISRTREHERHRELYLGGDENLQVSAVVRQPGRGADVLAVVAARLGGRRRGRARLRLPVRAHRSVSLPVHVVYGYLCELIEA